MKLQLKDFAKRVVGTAVRGLAKARVLPPWVIIQMDGGICSQMHFYRIASLMEQDGIKARLGFRWYEYIALDGTGRFCRNLDLPRLFPGLDLKKLPRWLESLYRIGLSKRIDYFSESASAEDWKSLRGPAYVTGYFHDNRRVYGPGFRETFRLDPGVLDARNRKLCREIDEIHRSGVETVAVHVRRGDLAVAVEAYGEPARPAYFARALQHFVSLNPDTHFYLFSDEPEWIAENLSETLRGVSHTVVDWNGSDKGYMDLVLMSRCRNIVTSQGSLGKYAAILRPDDRINGLVVLPSNNTSREWEPRFARALTLF